MVITKLKFSLLITCFTYLNDGKKSQMLFSTNFYTGEIAESLCSKADDDVIIARAKILRMKNVTYTNLT